MWPEGDLVASGKVAGPLSGGGHWISRRLAKGCPLTAFPSVQYLSAGAGLWMLLIQFKGFCEQYKIAHSKLNTFLECLTFNNNNAKEYKIQLRDLTVRALPAKGGPR